jgi:multidrug efflux pump subunit AcrA (membrane-fusion protein)
MLVDTGYPVAQGALIAVIEDDEIRQQLERSKAALAVVDAQIAQRQAELGQREDRAGATDTAGRVGGSLAERAGHAADALRCRAVTARLARAQRRQSEAEAAELTIRQGQTRITSPITGTVAQATRGDRGDGQLGQSDRDGGQQQPDDR